MGKKDIVLRIIRETRDSQKLPRRQGLRESKRDWGATFHTVPELQRSISECKTVQQKMSLRNQSSQPRPGLCIHVGPGTVAPQITSAYASLVNEASATTQQDRDTGALTALLSILDSYVTQEKEKFKKKKSMKLNMLICYEFKEWRLLGRSQLRSFK